MPDRPTQPAASVRIHPIIENATVAPRGGRETFIIDRVYICIPEVVATNTVDCDGRASAKESDKLFWIN